MCESDLTTYLTHIASVAVTSTPIGAHASVNGDAWRRQLPILDSRIAVPQGTLYRNV